MNVKLIVIAVLSCRWSISMEVLLINSPWRLKRILAPKSIIVPHSVIDGFGNEITDEANIRSEYKNDFKHRLRRNRKIEK